MEKLRASRKEIQSYHGIIVNSSLINQNILREFKIISTKQDEDWTLYKVEVTADKIESALQILKVELKPKFYAHFYRNNEFIVVFRDAVFRSTANHEDWKHIIEHGERQGLPREQLDFKPCKKEDETW